MCGHRPGCHFDRRPAIGPEHRSSQRCSSETRYITFIFRTRLSCAHNRSLIPASCPGRVDLLSGSYVRKVGRGPGQCPA